MVCPQDITAPPIEILRVRVDWTDVSARDERPIQLQPQVDEGLVVGTPLARPLGLPKPALVAPGGPTAQAAWTRCIYPVHCTWLLDHVDGPTQENAWRGQTAFTAEPAPGTGGYCAFHSTVGSCQCIQPFFEPELAKWYVLTEVRIAPSAGFRVLWNAPASANDQVPAPHGYTINYVETFDPFTVVHHAGSVTVHPVG